MLRFAATFRCRKRRLRPALRSSRSAQPRRLYATAIQAVAATPPSGKPSPEFQRHHAVAAPRVDSTAFRQGWRVNSRLLQLHAAGKITPGELQAAIDAHRAMARVLGLRGMALQPRVDGGWRGGVDLSASKHDAAERLRLARAALGQQRMILLQLCVVEDLPWQAIARRLGCSHRTAMARTIEAIQALAVHAEEFGLRLRRRR
jgi:hypothetical protein